MVQHYTRHFLLSAIVAGTLLSSVAQAQVITTVAGDGGSVSSGDGKAATSASVYPERIAIDAANNIYIADQIAGRIRKVNGSTGIITTYAGNGTYTSSGDGGPATSAGLYSPGGLAVDKSGNLYIADNAKGVIRKVTASTGIISTIAGTGTQGNSGDGGLATSAMFASPRDIALDANENIYVTDQSNYCVRKIDALTGIVTTVAGTNGTPGNSGDGGLATSAKMNDPIGIAVDAAGNIYIGDAFNHVIRKVTASTGLISTVAGCATCPDMGSPYSLKVDNAGNIYVADFTTHAARKIAAGTGVLSVIAGVPGNQGFTGDSGPATSAQLSYPTDIDLDASGNIFIADRSNYRVRKIGAAGNPTAVGPSGSLSIVKLQVYPNPAGGTFTISGVSVAQAASEVIKIELINELGAIVYSTTYQPTDLQWSLPVKLDDGISNGTYFLNVRTGGNCTVRTLQVRR